MDIGNPIGYRRVFNAKHAHPIGQVDVTDREAMKKAVSEAEAKFGPADLIVNNAGVMLLGELYKQDPSEWDLMFDVNIKGKSLSMYTRLE